MKWNTMWWYLSWFTWKKKNKNKKARNKRDGIASNEKNNNRNKKCFGKSSYNFRFIAKKNDQRSNSRISFFYRQIKTACCLIVFIYLFVCNFLFSNKLMELWTCWVNGKKMFVLHMHAYCFNRPTSDTSEYFETTIQYKLVWE